MKFLRILVPLIAALLLSASAQRAVAEEAQAPQSAAAQHADVAKPAWASNWRSQPEPVAQAGSTMMVALVGCIALFSFGIWAAKRLGLVKPAGTLSGLRVLERTPLSPKTSLCLVEARGKQFLVSVGSERVSLISSLRVGDSPEIDGSFEELLCEKSQPISAC